MKRYYVASILSDTIDENRIDGYGGVDGKSWKDSQKYPHLRLLVEDEEQQFLINESDPEDSSSAKDFFNEKKIAWITAEGELE